MTRSRPTIAVVGLGYGRSHVDEALRLGRHARLSAVVDARIDAATMSIPGVAQFSSLDDALENGPDIVVLATPIHTHARLTLQALDAGSHVLVEKPPTATLDEHRLIVEASERAARAVQVGFQARGSGAVAHVRAAIRAGAVGDVTHIGIVGRWVRTRAYYARAAWAGKRTLAGVPVMDGALTNPFAHAIDLALCLDEAYAAQDIDSVELDSWHAHDIEADDTTAALFTTRRGTRIAAGLTLASDTGPHEPVITVRGTTGRIEIAYEVDRVTYSTARDTWTETHGRTSLLENLVAHVSRDDALIAPIDRTGAFMAVLEEVRTSPLPRPIPADLVDWRGAGDDAHPAIRGVDALCARVGDTGRSFTELGAPWATRALSLSTPAD